MIYSFIKKMKTVSFLSFSDNNVNQSQSSDIDIDDDGDLDVPRKPSENVVAITIGKNSLTSITHPLLFLY